MRVTARDRVVVWVVRHAAWIHNRCRKLGDGRAPYFHVNGVEYHSALTEFMNAVLYKIPGRMRKLSARWSPGIW
eukprot:15448296-Alexandrium_andersonii.AAC.1